jgi:hypothetical protein
MMSDSSISKVHAATSMFLLECGSLVASNKWSNACLYFSCHIT